MDFIGAGRENNLVLSFYVHNYSNISCVNTSSLVRWIPALVFLRVHSFCLTLNWHFSSLFLAWIQGFTHGSYQVFLRSNQGLCCQVCLIASQSSLCVQSRLWLAVWCGHCWHPGDSWASTPTVSLWFWWVLHWVLHSPSC